MSATSYTVKRGDSLSRIASLVYRDSTRWQLLARANLLRDPYKVYIGQSLVVPEPPPKPRIPSPAPRPAPRTTDHSEERLAALAPPLASQGRLLLSACHAQGVRIQIGPNNLRTWPEQDALYAQGRTAPGPIVTYARAGESFHNFGLAFDILLLDASGQLTWDAGDAGWRIAGELGAALGLRWGGHWKRRRDLPHFELLHHLTLEECRRLCPLGLPEIWNRVS